MNRIARSSLWVVLLALAPACGDDSTPADAAAADVPGLDAASVDAPSSDVPRVDAGPADEFPAAGHAAGDCDESGLREDVSSPDQVVGDGSPASCTSEAVVSAVAAGGVITFNCGPDPIVIEMEETAKVFNDTGPRIVIDGGGLVTLSGKGERRILYMNTCDQEQVWTTAMCQNQDHPQLTVQDITFIDGNASSEEEGGGAIFVRGGQFKIIGSRFFRNRCAEVGPDVGGAAVRVLDQFEDRPIIVARSTFGGREDLGNFGSNGGGISSIGMSWTILNSLFSYNRAIGNGGNPTQPGTPGGGSGGAIYNDGNTMTLSICGSLIEHNEAVQHGSAIFFVSNDRSGNIVIDRSTITNNTGGSWYEIAPQISGHPETDYVETNSTVE